MAVVAIDYAKREHRVMIVNGAGGVLRQPFTVSNIAEGVAFLLEAVRPASKRHAIKPAQVIYGGEDEPAYVSNFLAAPAAKKALVVRSDALEAKNQRDQFTASSDDLDLRGISKCTLTRRVTMASDVHFPEAGITVLVQDNLNPHDPASLYEAYPPEEARCLRLCFEFHYKPNHGSC